MKKTMIALAAAALLIPFSAQAQDSSQDWEWRATIYGWLSGFEGQTQFPTGTDGPSFEVGIDDILDSLDFTLMGALHGHKGDWGLFTDVLYLDVGGSESQTRQFLLGPQDRVPVDVQLDARLDMKSWLWTVAGSYSLSRSDTHLVDLTFGARMLDLTQELNWAVSGEIGELPLEGNEGFSKVSATNWDAVIGLQGYNLVGSNGSWVIPWLVDVGTGDSDLVWQAMAGFGYRFGWGDVLLTYRYLDYENDDDKLISDLTMSGAMVAASFTW